MGTFGRMNNLVRRPARPDGRFHRSKRRRGLDTPLAISRSAWGGARALLSIVLRPMRLLARWRRI